MQTVAHRPCNEGFSFASNFSAAVDIALVLSVRPTSNPPRSPLLALDQIPQTITAYEDLRAVKNEKVDGLEVERPTLVWSDDYTTFWIHPDAACHLADYDEMVSKCLRSRITWVVASKSTPPPPSGNCGDKECLTGTSIEEPWDSEEPSLAAMVGG